MLIAAGTGSAFAADQAQGPVIAHAPGPQDQPPTLAELSSLPSTSTLSAPVAPAAPGGVSTLGVKLGTWGARW